MTRTKLPTTLALLLALLFLFTQAQPALAQTPTNPVVILFFWGDGCPHCAKAKPFLEELKTTNPAIEVRAYEVWNDKANQDILLKVSQEYNFEPRYVPTIIIGDKVWEGYNDEIQTDITTTVQACLTTACALKPTTAQATQPLGAAELIAAAPQPAADSAPSPTSNPSTISLPFLGKVDLKTQPLIISTLLIGFVDGVNPCSIWVLTMLLALTLHTGSRRKVLIIGLIFLTVTTAIYGLFIVGVFTLLKVVQFIGWVQWVVALAALFFAFVNIKDYFWYKKGLSFTIPENQKPGIYQRMRNVINNSDNFWALASGTIVLGVGVSLVEFSCTAGFPVIWSNLLNAQHVTTPVFSGLLFLYLLIYQLDELALFLIAVATMRASRMEEKHGRLLKLIGGSLMFCLAMVMLINPNLMNDLASSLWVFGAALALTLLILFFDKLLLPFTKKLIDDSFQRKLKQRSKHKHNRS